MQMWIEYEIRLKIRREPYSRRYEWGNSATDYQEGFENETIFRKDGPLNLAI